MGPDAPNRVPRLGHCAVAALMPAGRRSIHREQAGTVSVSRLKARLSAVLAAVRAGRPFVVTDRGKPVARIDPVDPADDPNTLLDTLVARGLARRPVAQLPPDFFVRPFPADSDGLVLRALLAELGSGKG